MNDNVTPGEGNSNIHRLPVAVTRPLASALPGVPAQVVQTPFWSDEVRIRNLTDAIGKKYGGEIFLTSDQVTDLFKISARTLGRIPQKKLPRFNWDGCSGFRYATVDLAGYYVLFAQSGEIAMATG